MRRNNLFVDRQISPSKQALGRRLFPSQGNEKALKLARTSRIRRRYLSLFSIFAISFIILVHLFLIKQLVNTNEKTQEEKNNRPSPNHGLRNSKLWNPPTLTKLRPIDVEEYTIRINTWRRPEQLLISVDHHSSCAGVSQIQIVWCDKENDPPKELYNYSKVVIEKHEENSLNERFRILSPTKTLGILSIDDDVLRPCEAIDSGFFKWTQFPNRMIGFDARVHVENKTDDSWTYGYMSTMEKTNKYSLSLTRYCFIHKDYMDIYTNHLPKSILDRVAKNFNCEDIAMSFMISSMTSGKPSLLADLWAIKSMIKMYVEEKISGTKSHKSLRDECIDSFASLMGLKDEPTRLKPSTYITEAHSLFGCGDIPQEKERQLHLKGNREIEHDKLLNDWRDKEPIQVQKELKRMMGKAALKAYKAGLIEKTDVWKERFDTRTNL